MNFLELLLPDFALILLGYAMCRWTALNRSVWAQIDRLVFYFLFPVLLFHSIVRRPIDLVASRELVLCAVILVSTGVLLSFCLGLLPRVDKRQHAGAAQIAFRFNSFFALAVSERLGGAPALQLMAILMGISVPLCNMAAVWMMARQSHHQFLRTLLTNPLVLATAGGLLANMLGFAVPSWAEPSVNRIGYAALVLGLMAAGAGMQFAQMRATPLISVGVLGIRHCVAPMVAAVLVVVLRLPLEQATVLMIFSAMPTAPTAYVLASKMGYNGPYVAALVSASTLLSLVSLPMALWIIQSGIL